MHRDFVGYGNCLPQVAWPKKARVAVSFVLNYEEGSESNILDGDRFSEGYLHDLPGVLPLENARHLSVESLFEYGSRAGIWRLLDLFEQYRIPVTIFATGQALERNPALIQALKNSSHEIAGHGYRWINYQDVSPEVEKEHIVKTLTLIKTLTGKQVKGWYASRKSPNTRQLLVEAGLQYDSDSYADDLPYWIKVADKNHLIIPYALDTNDLKYTTSPGWSSGHDFLTYLKNTFNTLYREGASHPKMMSIGLHPRLSGRPGRCEVLKQFIEYIQGHLQVWICRREEIAHHWMTNQAEV